MKSQRVRAMLDAFSQDKLVLDVGGWARADQRADWVIDIGSYETRNWYSRELGEAAGGPERFTAESWVQMDICVSPWPFETGMFDYVICSQTLEDIRDPISVCKEMMRVGRAGYIETPSAVTELTRGIQSPHWCGWQHHRWLVQNESGALVFFGKQHHIHSPLWPAVRSPRFLVNGAGEPLQFEWSAAFPVREDVVVDGREADTYMQRIIASSTRPDPVGVTARRARAGASAVYRAARRSLGALRRA
jgi:hypothetical protein